MGAVMMRWSQEFVLFALGSAFIAAALTGCAPTNLADVLEAAGKDPASVCGSITTIYGTAKFARTNIVNGNVSCNQDGLSVKSDAVQVPLQLQVNPVGVVK